MLIDQMVGLIHQMLIIGSTYIGQPEGEPMIINMILFVFLFSIIFIGTTVINYLKRKR